jgi:hypothetical protein
MVFTVYQQSKKVEYVFKNLWFCIENSNSILFSPVIQGRNQKFLWAGAGGKKKIIGRGQ